jgi:hypothetical protein
MNRLVAHFDIPLPGQCLVAMPEDRDIVARCTVGSFAVELTLLRDMSQGSKPKDAEHFARALYRTRIKASRVEAELPPPVIADARGIRDYSIQLPYFQARTSAFESAACEAVNRTLRFFRFVLATPLIHDLSATDQCFLNAEWTDENGKIVGKPSMVVGGAGLVGARGQFGVRTLAPNDLGNLEQYIAEARQVSLVEQLLSDARSAWFEKNLTRAVLELAIACEVAVKRRFFEFDTPAGAAFDYLEDKSRVRVQIVDLIHGVAQEAFGKSFKVDHAQEYDHVDHLFRCRNKVAHRGELVFRVGDTKITADAKRIETWWASVDALIQWLAALDVGRTTT